MDQQQLEAHLQAAFDDLPRQLQAGARWILDHPIDVALLSMREQAKRVGIPAATLTRLAKRLGFDGFEDLRRIYARSVRQRPESFTGRAEELVARHGTEGDAGFVADTAAFLKGHLEHLAHPSAIAALSGAADRIAGAERVYCLGLRSSFPVAYIFHYVRSLLGAASVLVDGAGSIGLDTLQTAGPRDVLLVVSVKPYTRSTVEACRYAGKRGLKIVAISDSSVSPLAQLADELILVSTATPSFFHTMTPAFAAVEILTALVAVRKGADSLSAIAHSESQLSAFNTYIDGRKRSR